MDPISFLISIIITVASTLAQQAFAPKPQDAGPRGYRGSIATGGKVPQSFLVGTVGTAGKLEYRHSWGKSGGTPNAYLVDVVSFGDLPGCAMTGLFINGEKVTLSTSGHVQQGYPVSEYNDDGDGHFWQEFFNGSQTSANEYLVDKFGGDSDRPWQADMVGRGLPYATFTALIDDGLWSGFPTYMAELQGIPLYDPRKDSTAGGSGTQRWSDPTTWAFSDNNIVIVYNIYRGIHYNGEKVWGGDATAYQLPYANWAAAMDKADLLIDKKSGGTERQFRGGREIEFGERPADVIQEFLVGANARVAHTAAGQIYILVGVPSAVVGSFTDADLLATDSSTLTPFPNLDGIVNGATASYVEPQQAWESKETAPYYRSDLEAEDDGRRQVQGLDLGTTFSGTQAQRILQAVVEESRRFGRHVLPFPPIFGAYNLLEALSWTSAANGYSTKWFLIIAKTEDQWGNVILGLQEIDPADHDWDPQTDEQPLDFAPLTTARPAPQVMTGWQALPAVLQDATGAGRRPSIEVRYDGGLVDVRGVRVQVRENWSDKRVIFDGEIPYDLTTTTPAVILNGPFLPAQNYEVHGKYVPASGRKTEWSIWLAVTTPDVRLLPEDLAPELNEAFDDIQHFLDEDLPSLGASGVNLLEDTYSWLTSIDLPPVALTTATVVGVAVPASASGFGYLVKSTTTGTGAWFSPSSANTTAGRNIEIEPGTYIVSAYVSSTAAGHQVRPRIYGTGISFYGASKVMPQNARTRVSWEVVVTASGRAAVLFYHNMHAGPVTDELTIDSIMVERKAAASTSSAPSPFVPGPSVRTIAALASTVSGKADASAVADLQTSVTQQGNNIVSGSRDMRKLQSAIMNAALLAFEQGAGQIESNTDALAAAATAMEFTRTETRAIEGVVTALVETISQLQASAGGNLAEAISQVQVVASEQQAQAAAIDMLRVALGGGSSEVLIKWEAVAAPTGFTARYALRVMVEEDGQLRQASMFLDVPSDPGARTRIGFSADETVFFDALGNALALIGGDGVLRSTNNAFQADMITGDVTMTKGNIRSADGEFLISPSLKRISIST
jgi:hypothetical protein